MFGLGGGLGAAATTMLMVAVVVAAIVMWTSWFAAVRASRGHAPFEAHLEKRKLPGYDAIPHMPQAASGHVRRHFVAFGVFLVLPLFFFFSGA